MKIPVEIIAVLLTALLGVNAWTLNAVVDLKAEVAALKMLVTHQPSSTIAKNEH